MALDNSDLGPDEVDLGIGNNPAWEKSRKHWRKYLKEWERELYYPVFAGSGISKGHALTAYITKTEIVDIYNLLVVLRKELISDNDDDEEGDSWKQRRRR